MGHLMAQTDACLANSLARRFEDRWLDEMDDPRIAAWAQAHGFTVDELAWIQPSYCWQPPMCDDVAAAEVDYVADEPTCPDAQPWPNPWASTDQAWFCQDGCDGPFRVFLQVENLGASDAAGVEVQLWAPADEEVMVLDSVTVDIAALSAQIVELQTVSVLDLTNGGIAVIAPDSCTPQPHRQIVWDTGNGGVGWIPPAECGYTCDDDTGVGDGSVGDGGVGDGGNDSGDASDADASPRCGCDSTPPTPWMTLPLTALATQRRR